MGRVVSDESGMRGLCGKSDERGLWGERAMW